MTAAIYVPTNDDYTGTTTIPSILHIPNMHRFTKLIHMHNVNHTFPKTHIHTPPPTDTHTHTERHTHTHTHTHRDTHTHRHSHTQRNTHTLYNEEPTGDSNRPTTGRTLASSRSLSKTPFLLP